MLDPSVISEAALTYIREVKTGALCLGFSCLAFTVSVLQLKVHLTWNVVFGR